MDCIIMLFFYLILQVELRRGVVEALYVEMDEPVHVTNIKKAIVANLNMDISASRRAEITSNSIQVSFSIIIIFV